MPEPYLRPKVAAIGRKSPLAWPEELVFGMPEASFEAPQAPESVVVRQKGIAKVLALFVRAAASKKVIAQGAPLAGTVAEPETAYSERPKSA